MGCERNHEVRIQTAEIKFLHGLAASVHTDHQCNEKNGEKLFSPNTKIQSYEHNCLAHLQNWKTIKCLSRLGSTSREETQVLEDQ
jgi:hypothetical protein